MSELGTLPQSDCTIADNVTNTQLGMTDVELLARVIDGDNIAFVELMRRYKEPITNFVYRYLGNYDDAIDVAQETFVRVFRFGSSFSGEVKFSTWLFTIASNLSKSELKRYYRRNGTSAQLEFAHSDEDQSWDIPDENYMPDQHIDCEYITQCVQKALMSVSSSYREVVILRDVQQMSYEEIAQIVGIDMGTVKSRINRGRAQLQVLLKDLHTELFSLTNA